MAPERPQEAAAPATLPPAAAICPAAELTELGSHRFRVLYRGQPRAAILVRFQGVAIGYLNQCVHMPKELDCEQRHVFDAAGQSIRCSMHGITYEPHTGDCLSEICAGKSLTPLRVQERDGFVYLTEKRATLLAADISSDAPPRPRPARADGEA